MTELEIMWAAFNNALEAGDLAAAVDILRVIAPHDPDGVALVLTTVKVLAG